MEPYEWGHEEILVCLCPNCDRPSAVLYEWAEYHDEHLQRRTGWVRRMMWPTRTPNAPDYLPDGIGALYKEAVAALVHGLARSCLLMTRTTLSAMLEEKGKEGTLEAQIEASEEVLGDDLSDVAGTLRGVGNSGAHDFDLTDEWTTEDARNAIGFLNEVAQRIYARPARLKALKEKAKAARDSS